MIKLRSICLSIATLLALGSAAPAHAYLVFFGEDVNNSEDTPIPAFPNALAAEVQFLAGLATFGTEDFEGFADGTAEPLNLSFPGAGTATLQGGAGEINSVTAGSTNGAGRYGTSPTNYWNVAAGGEGDFEILFGEAVAAFGFFGVDIGDFGGDLEIALSLAGGGIEMFSVPHTVGEEGSTGGSVLFYGLVAEMGDALIESAAFLTQSGDDDFFGFDDFTIGVPEQEPPNVIPEPTTALLFALGLTGLGVRGRRSRR